MKIHVVLLTAALVLGLVACSKPVIPPVVKQPVPAVQAPEVAPAPAAAPVVAAVEPAPAPAAKPAPVKHKPKAPAKPKSDGAVYVDGERIGRGECNALFAAALLYAVDSKISGDVALHKVRDFGNILTHPSVIEFRARCASLPV